jgi:hypothetical protein
MLLGETASWSFVPSTAFTTARQVVVPPAVVGVNFRRASAGNVLSTPSIDQSPFRPKTCTGSEELALKLASTSTRTSRLLIVSSVVPR